MTTDAIADPLESRERPTRLRSRREYVRASKFGAKHNTPLFSIQGVNQPHDQSLVAQAPPRCGFTVTKKVAGAVGRTRIRRRLKEALRLGGRLGAQVGQDYVIVARRDALRAPFAEIIFHMSEGFRRLKDRKESRGKQKLKDGRPAQ